MPMVIMTAVAFLITIIMVFFMPIMMLAMPIMVLAMARIVPVLVVLRAVFRVLLVAVIASPRVGCIPVAPFASWFMCTFVGTVFFFIFMIALILVITRL